MLVQCPNCRTRFDDMAFGFGEEVLNPSISVVRRKIECSSWTALAMEIQSGYAYRVVSVGDEIPFTLKNGESVVAVAVHENPYWNNSMAFVIKDCLKDKCRMNVTNTNSGGYAATELRRHLIDDIVSLLPDELVSVIKPRTIVQKYTDAEYNSTDLIWAPSRTEIVSIPRDNFKDDNFKDIDFGDIHFDFFSDERSSVKMAAKETCCWWLRSFTVVNSNGLIFGGGDDNIIFGNAKHSFGVVFGFLI